MSRQPLDRHHRARLLIEVPVLLALLVAVFVAVSTTFRAESTTIDGESFDCGSPAQPKDWAAVRRAQERIGVTTIPANTTTACHVALDDARSRRTAALSLSTLFALALAGLIADRWMIERRNIQPLREAGIVSDRLDLERVASTLRDPRVVSVAVALVRPIDTERLRIRPPERADADPLREIIDDAVIEANGWQDHHADHLVRAVERGWKIGARLVCDRRTGDLLGAVSARVREREGFAELGFWMGPHARGRGYGTEAVEAVTRSLHAVGVEHVEVATAVDNFGVRRIMEKLNATEIRWGLQHLPDGRDLDSVWYVLRPDGG